MCEMLLCGFVMYIGILIACLVVGLLMAEITATDVMASSWQQRVDTASGFIRRCALPDVERSRAALL